MQRFFVPPDAIHANKIDFPEGAAHQIRNVFHMNPGDRVIVLDDTGWEYQVTLQLVSRTAVVGEVELRSQTDSQPGTDLTLFAALLKKDNFEWVLQKCTELGIGTIVPMITKRTIMAPPSEKKLERWHRIILEAAEQCGRARLPQLENPIEMSQVLPRLSEYDRTLLFWTGAGRKDLNQLLGGVDDSSSIACLVGPEGGFTEEEAEQAQLAGALQVSLGPRILRAETAAVVVTALVMYERGDLSAHKGK
jgi:16S rRNA (uracil1498-N3)-methyltransferase